jgi:signal recognition particle receptor subunit beta
MASINYAHKEIISKIVYYGPGLSGKTTNLQYVFRKVPAETRGELISLATDADRTLYFDFLPLNVGTIQGFATKFQLYTVPGQVYYNATRKLVLRGVDGIVFVVDSQAEKLDENIESQQNLKDNLAEYGYDIDSIPMVIQYNKRDLPNAMEISELQKLLNPKVLPHFEAVAPTGDGVFKTLKAISKMVLEEIRKNKMGAPNAVKPRPPQVEQKPEPVSAAVSSSGTVKPPKKTENHVAASEMTDSRASEASDNQPVVEQHAEEAPQEDESESKRQVAGIVEDSEVLANVVVSDSQKLPNDEDESAEENNLEDTTERAVLQEESDMVGGRSRGAVDHQREIQLSDKYEEESGSVREPIYGTLPQNDGFDEESTQISNLNLKNPLPLGKPQMAESRKVKNKRRKFSLFGLFKK